MSVEVSMKSGIKLFDNKEHEEESVKVFYRLVAYGANSVNGGYGQEEKDLMTKFLSSPLRLIAPVWQDLNSQVKIRVLDEHIEEFTKWLEGEENG